MNTAGSLFWACFPMYCLSMHANGPRSKSGCMRFRLHYRAAAMSLKGKLQLSLRGGAGTGLTF